MTINRGIVRGNSGRMSCGRSQKKTDAPAANARIGVREALASHTDQDQDVGAHQAADRDFASATPTGTAIANKKPTAIGPSADPPHDQPVSARSYRSVVLQHGKDAPNMIEDIEPCPLLDDRNGRHDAERQTR